MNIDVFNEAVELRNRQILCEDIMKYMSDPEAVKGMKYKELLATFAKTFESEFMMFVHTMGIKAAEAFYELHDCCPDCGCDNCATEEPETPPTDAKFQIGDRVEVVKSISSILIGSVGTVESYNLETENYGVRLDRFPADALLLWYAADELALYVEKEEPEPIVPDEDMLAVGDKVKVIGGVWPDLIGKIGEVVAFYEARNTISVLFDFDGEPYEFNYSEIEKCDPDTFEESGNGNTDPTEGE